MSVFEIPELVALVAPYLTPQDLTHCVRVSKEWHARYIPFLWRRVSPTAGLPEPEDLYLSKMPFRCWSLFRKLVVEDYDYSRQSRQQGQGEERPLPALSRYGQWIRTLSVKPVDMQEMPESFARFDFNDPSSIPGLQPSDDLLGFDPTSQDYARDPAMPLLNSLQAAIHGGGDLFGVLAALRAHTTANRYLQLHDWTASDNDLNFWKAIATDVVPNLLGLEISFDAEISRPRSTIPLLLASWCSSKMQELKMPIYYHFRHEIMREKETEQEEEVGGEEEEKLIGMKDLNVESIDQGYYPPAWPRFLRRCTNLESLEVTRVAPNWVRALHACVHLESLKIHKVNTASVRLITDAIRTSLHKLNQIDIVEEYNDLEEGVVAEMISAGQAGWRSIVVPTLDSAAADAVLRHCRTLRQLEVKRSAGLTSAHMQQTLSSSPNLISFVTLYNYPYNENMQFSTNATHFMALDFIDRDPDTGTLKPWLCESILKVFVAKILGIPRPDITKNCLGRPCQGGLQDTYPGQSQELQRGVYERLARFRYLEDLALGHDDRNWDGEGQYVQNPSGTLVFNDRKFQYECLDMTLNSGLGLLEVMKELKCVDVMRMATRIGVKDIRWMVKSWPKLERFFGMDINDDEVEEKAIDWLANETKIEMQPYCMDEGL
ncbi:hypothetical protein BGX23_006361 [Mortierella sp. AD031]|nr:hypothetical protein BGX23_006361 [Mortierella sp. AD031]